MKYFQIRKEGEASKPGFNFYPMSDKHSAGFVFKFGKRALWVRYRKKFGDLIVKHSHIISESEVIDKCLFCIGTPKSI